MLTTNKSQEYHLLLTLKKAFGSIDHKFLFASLKTYGFGEYFLKWIRILYNEKESSVLTRSLLDSKRLLYYSGGITPLPPLYSHFCKSRAVKLSTGVVMDKI